MFKLFRKITTLCIVLASTIVVNAQTPITWGTFVTPRTNNVYQRDLASDASGNIFGAGCSDQVPTTQKIPKGNVTTNANPVYDTTYGGGSWDGYLYKMSSDGKNLVWWT